MATSPAPICSNTKSKIFFNFLANVQSRCNGQNWGTRYKTSWKTAKRQLNSHFIPKPISKEADLAIWRGRWGQKLPCEWTPPPPSWVVLSTILSVLAEKQKLKIDCNFQFSMFTLPPKTEKLSHATDCSIVGKANLPLSFIFLFIVDRIKVKI